MLSKPSRAVGSGHRKVYPSDQGTLYDILYFDGIYEYKLPMERIRYVPAKGELVDAKSDPACLVAQEVAIWKIH